MELRYGSRETDAVLDLRTGDVTPYTRDHDDYDEWNGMFHRTFGGQQFYRSRSALSGAGWVPDSPWLLAVPTLRTDVYRPRVPDASPLLGANVRVVQPMLGLRAGSGPIVIVDGEDGEDDRGEDAGYPGAGPRVYTDLDAREILQLLQGEPARARTETREVELTSHDRRGRRTTVRDVTVHGRARRWGVLSLRRVLELLFWRRLYWPDARDRYATTEWHNSLGLAVGEDGRLYHAAGGILRERVPEPLTTDYLRRSCPWAWIPPVTPEGWGEWDYVSADRGGGYTHYVRECRTDGAPPPCDESCPRPGRCGGPRDFHEDGHHARHLPFEDAIAAFGSFPDREPPPVGPKPAPRLGARAPRAHDDDPDAPLPYWKCENGGGEAFPRAAGAGDSE